MGALAITELRTELAALVPGLDLSVEAIGDRTKVLLPAAPGADYRFVVEVFGSGQAAIVAMPVSEPEAEYFWFMEWEPSVSVSLEVRNVLPYMRRLALNPTRIVQTRGRLGLSFKCEAFEEGSWTRVGDTVTVLGGSMGLGDSTAKVVTYSSPRLSAPGDASAT